MKRAFPQKVKPVSSQAVDGQPNLGQFKQAPEGNRRTHASAAMIGLAISMGASSIVLPQQGEGALAAEPKTVDAITPTALTTFENGTAESEIVVETTGAETETLRQSANQPESGIELFTQWQPLQTPELGKNTSAAKNNISYQSILFKEAKIQSPSENSSTRARETNAPAATALSERDAFSFLTNSIQENQAAPEAAYVIESKIADEVSEIFAAKQNYIKKANNKLASEQFEQSSNRLEDSLAEFGTEESVNSPEASAVSAPSKAATDEIAFPFITNQANQATSSEKAKKQLDNSAAAKVRASSVLIPLPGEISTNLQFGIPASEATASENVFSPFSPTKNNSLEVPTLLPNQNTSQAETTATVKENFLQQSLPTSETVATTPELEKLETGEVTVKEKAVTTSDKVVTPDFSQAVALLPEQPQPVVEYRVNDGDTLDSIARNYGVSVSVLAKYNQISAPNLLTVGQTLEIPLYQPGRQEIHTTALIEKSQPDGIASISYQPTKELKVDKQVPFVAWPNSTASAYNPSVTLSLEATTSEVESSQVGGALREPTASVANFPASKQSTNLEPATASYLYNKELISEMVKIREKYRSQETVTPTTNAQVSSLIAETNELVDEAANNKLTSARVNPEFLPNQYPGTEELASNQNQQSAGVSAPTKNTSPVATTPYEQEIVATAPTGTEAFESVIQPRMVSPELPPLASPDNYLPKGSAVFTGYIWPAQGVLTSGYGWRWGRMHKGIDIAGPVGTPIVAAAPGVITYARWNEGGYGNLVEITHPDGSVTLYAHNERILVREGQEVEQGQQVAEMGSTGFSTGPHLHFEIHPPGQGAVNPLAYLP